MRGESQKRGSGLKRSGAFENLDETCSGSGRCAGGFAHPYGRLQKTAPAHRGTRARRTVWFGSLTLLKTLDPTGEDVRKAAVVFRRSFYRYISYLNGVRKPEIGQK